MSATTIVYKGSGWLDLRAAELTAPATTLLAVAYKSRITILVPPGIRVEAGGFGADTDTDPGAVVAADAPVLHVRGFTYKGTVEVRTGSLTTGRPASPAWPNSSSIAMTWRCAACSRDAATAAR